jgi:hypothetical protein
MRATMKEGGGGRLWGRYFMLLILLRMRSQVHHFVFLLSANRFLLELLVF